MYFPAHFAPIKNEWLELLSSGIIILLSLFFLYASADRKQEDERRLRRGCGAILHVHPSTETHFSGKLSWQKSLALCQGCTPGLKKLHTSEAERFAPRVFYVSELCGMKSLFCTFGLSEIAPSVENRRCIKN
jgi:hypothetical protein